LKTPKVELFNTFGKDMGTEDQDSDLKRVENSGLNDLSSQGSYMVKMNNDEEDEITMA